MEELGEYDESFQENQKKLMEKQREFEGQQRAYEENAEAIDAAEHKKMSIMNWAVIGLTFIFVLLLAYWLLF